MNSQIFLSKKLNNGFAFLPVLVLGLLVAGLVIGVNAVKEKTQTNSKAYGAADCAGHDGFAGYGDDCDCGTNGGTIVRIVECNDGTTLPAEVLGGSCKNACDGGNKIDPNSKPLPPSGPCQYHEGFDSYGDDCDCSLNQPNGQATRVAICGDGTTVSLEQLPGGCGAGECKDGQKTNPNSRPKPAQLSCSGSGVSQSTYECDCGRRVGNGEIQGEMVKIIHCTDGSTITGEPTGFKCNAGDCTDVQQTSCGYDNEGKTQNLGCGCFADDPDNGRCEGVNLVLTCTNNLWVRSYENDSGCDGACNVNGVCQGKWVADGNTTSNISEKVWLAVDNFGKKGANVPGDNNGDFEVNIIDVTYPVSKVYLPIISR